MKISLLRLRLHVKKEIMRNKRISSDSCSDSLRNSSDFSDDDIPLKMLKMNGCTQDPNSYSSLCEHSIQACEFCDRISKNRFSSLIHNVSHIIIPLIKQTVFQCENCLYHFTSKEDLKTHLLKKHLNLKMKSQTIGVKREKKIHLNHQSKSPEQDSTHKLKLESTVKKKEEPEVQSIKNRLVFEDDDVIFLDSNQLLNDLTTDCKVNLELFEAPWLSDEFSGTSVHYDELMKPGVYRCKKCGKGFPIRYDAIKHETSHLTFKDTQVSLCIICKQYMMGDRSNLRLHYLIHHKEKSEKQTHTYHYNEPEKMLNKRIIFEEETINLLEDKTDPLEDKTGVLEDKNDVLVDKRSRDYTKTLFLCELCFSFCKNKSGTNYECVETISEVGKRYKCEKCGFKFFEITVVKRHIQQRKVPTYITKKKKYTTNEERLKLITQRFKMMKH